MKSLFWWVSLLVALATGAFGACVPYTNASAPITFDLCASFLDSDVFSPFPLRLIDSKANSSVIFQLRAVYPLIPLECSTMILRLACRTAFPSCNFQYVEQLNTTVVTSRPLCRSVCTQTNSICSSFFHQISYTPFNCSSKDPLNPGNPQWPEGDIQVVSNGATLNVSCSPANEYVNQTFMYDFGRCPFFLANNPKPSQKDPPCAVPCPDPSFTPQQYKILVQTINAISTISLVLATFTTWTFLLSPIRRKHPARLQIFPFVSIMVFQISLLLNGPEPERDLWCQNEVSANKMTSPHVNWVCMLQGVLFIQFGLSTCFWCAVLSLNLYLKIRSTTRRDTTQLTKFYHLFAWGVPFIMVVIALGFKAIGYVAGAPWCFVGGVKAFKVGGFNIDYLLFYIPLGFSCFVAIFFFLATSRVLFIHFRKVNKHKSQAGSDILYGMKWRILFFCFSLFSIFVSLIAFRAQIGEEGQVIAATDLAWVTCKFKAAAGVSNNTACAGDDLPLRSNFGIALVTCIFASSLGIVVFISFGVDSAAILCWRIIGTLIVQHRWRDLRRYIMLERFSGWLNGEFTGSSENTATTQSHSRPASTDMGMLPSPRSAALPMRVLAVSRERERVYSVDYPENSPSDVSPLE